MQPDLSSHCKETKGSDHKQVFVDITIVLEILLDVIVELQLWPKHVQLSYINGEVLSGTIATMLGFTFMSPGGNEVGMGEAHIRVT